MDPVEVDQDVLNEPPRQFTLAEVQDDWHP
jgi:hypothetical protein